jgi:hypothetical protein
MKGPFVAKVILVSSFALTVASLYVVMENAWIEPYVVFRKYDAVMQVGAGTTLIFLWLVLAITIIVWASRRRILVSLLAWLPVLLWILICEFYLFHAVSGYLEDISHHVLHQKTDAANGSTAPSPLRRIDYKSV